MRLENVVDGEGKRGLWFGFIVLRLKVGRQERGEGELGEPLEAGEAQVRVEEHHGRDHHRGEQRHRGWGRDSQRGGREILTGGRTWKNKYQNFRRM